MEGRDSMTDDQYRDMIRKTRIEDMEIVLMVLKECDSIEEAIERIEDMKKELIAQRSN